MRKDEYIQEVISRIENKKAKAEVERELSNHIDDRISYYTDAGWDEETANEKAMEHMGKPEKVSEKMGKLHDERHHKVFIALIVTIIIHTLVSAIIHAFADVNFWAWYNDETYYGLYLIVLTCALNLIVYFLARKAHKQDSFAYLFLLAIQISRITLLSLAPLVDHYIYSKGSFIVVILNAVVLVLSVICCRWYDEKQKGIMADVAAFSASVPLSVLIDIFLIITFIYNGLYK